MANPNPTPRRKLRAFTKTVRLTEREAGIVESIAQADEQTDSDVIRALIREAGKRRKIA